LLFCRRALARGYLTCHLCSLVMCPQYWKHAYAQHSHRTGTGKKDESSPFRPGRDSSTNVITAVRSQQVPSLFEGYTHFRRTPALPASATRVFFFFFADPHDDHGVVISASSYNGATRTGVIAVYDSLLRLLSDYQRHFRGYLAAMSANRSHREDSGAHVWKVRGHATGL
jgi:hypothetical protein